MVHMKKSGSPKKRTKGPRIALRLPKDAQALHTRGLAIWSAIKADATRFPTTYPPAAEVEADLAGLGAALQAVEGGGPIAKAALDVAADKVKQTLEFLGKYVQSVVRAGPVEDAPAIISNVLMFESAVGKRAPKPEIEAREGMTSGNVQLLARAVASAAAYFWEYSDDQQTWTAPFSRSVLSGRVVALVVAPQALLDGFFHRAAFLEFGGEVSEREALRRRLPKVADVRTHRMGVKPHRERNDSARERFLER